MNIQQNAAGHPGGAGRSRLVNSQKEATLVTIAQVAGRLAIAQLAIDLVAAQNEVFSAKYRYNERIQKFERKHAAIEGRLDRRNPDHAAALVYTDKTYSDYQLARRNAYNIKRRLETAVRRDRGGIR